MLSVLTSCAANPRSPGNTALPLVSLPSVSKDRILTVDVDQIAQGFNPHLRSQLSQSSLLVAALTLPSPFEEIVESNGSIHWQIRNDLFSNITSSLNRFTGNQTIIYHINPDAQWSDNTPITGDDFIYLWQQMISQPGVVNKYAYETIKNIHVTDGGLTVIVKLIGAFPDWHSLFSELLPSHALRDSAKAFQTGLFLSSPLSGSYFVMLQALPDLKKIVLVRNERYWATMPPIDYIELDKIGQMSDAYVALQTQPLHILMIDGSNAFDDILKEIPGIRLFSHPMPQELSIFLNPERLNSLSLRKTLFEALNYHSLVNSAFLDKMHVFNSVITPLARSSHDVNLIGESLKSGVADFHHFMRTHGYSLVNTISLRVKAGRDKIDSPPELLKEDISQKYPPYILVNPQKKPVFFVIGVAEDDTAAKIVAQNLAIQLSNLGVIPKIRMMPASDLFGKSSQYFDTIITYDRLGYGKVSDTLSAISHDFYSPLVRAKNSTTLPAALRLLLSGKLNAQQQDAWKKTFLEHWTWIPLGQRMEITAIGSDIHMPYFIRSTMSGNLTDVQLWNFNPRSAKSKPK